MTGGEIQVRRAKREDLVAIAGLVPSSTRGQVKVHEAEVMDWLFGKGMMVALDGDILVGVVTWQAENLLSVTDALYLMPGSTQATAGQGLLDAIEAEATTLMCEANVVLLPPWVLPEDRGLLQNLGYEPSEFEALHRIWREVLSELVEQVPELMVKRLRDRMVMVPI
jgi:hypothetical protein